MSALQVSRAAPGFRGRFPDGYSVIATYVSPPSLTRDFRHAATRSPQG